MKLALDTDVDRDFPVYTRANASEVLPGIVSPLGWSLIGQPFEQGFRTSLCRDCGAVAMPRDRDFLFVGRFAGRFHLNLSVLRTAADHLVGTSPAAVDAQYFGDAARLGLPSHQSTPVDRLWYLRSGPAVGRTMATLARRIRREREMVEALGAQNRGFVAADPPDAAVVAELRALRPDLARTFATHITARALCSSAVELLAKAIARAGGPPELSLRLLSGLADLESSQPGLALQRLAGGLEPASPLGKAVAVGTTWDELRASGLDGAERLADDVAAFLDRFGHRGLNEWNPTVPAWEQRPDDVLTLLAPLVGCASIGSGTRRDGRDELAALAHGPRARLLSALAANAQAAVLRGETTKGTAIRVTHELRRLVEVLRRRWADRLAPGDLDLLTLDELDALARGGAVPDALGRRRVELAAAEDVDVPEVLVGEVRTVPRQSGRATATILEGIAGSAGCATGRARVLTCPDADLTAGEVLVVSVTDTAWTPQFLAAAAVVTDVGGILSHATIVARDLGIPAVVNTKTATRDIATGDLVEVDGSTGVVRVLERVARSRGESAVQLEPGPERPRQGETT